MSGTYLTPPAIAKKYGVAPETVVGWIRSGELVAIDVAQRGKSRPRYRVSPHALEAFELRRSAVVKTEPVRKPRQTKSVKSYV